MKAARKREIERYLRTGDSDSFHPAWGGGVFQAARQAKEDLKSALIEEAKGRACGMRSKRVPRGLDLRAFTRAKVEAMVRGLFPAREREPVLSTLERSVVFVTRSNIERLIRNEAWLSTAWQLANLYLTGLGAEPLGDGESPIVGFSEETTCYLSTEYFAAEDKFADFVVHEVAHIFHNCKRGTVGLPETRKREWLLNIDFGMRETFAYGCEAYSCLRELGPRPADRHRLLAELLRGPMPPTDLVDEDAYREMLSEAVAARNGWKRILARCAPSGRGQ
ncbi:MAG: hypothetical protein ACE5GX_17735 [Thermoanaerobaculia bacterium]